MSSNFQASNVFASKTLKAYKIFDRLILFTFSGYTQEGHTVHVGDEIYFNSIAHNLQLVGSVSGMVHNSGEIGAPISLLLENNGTTIKVRNTATGKRYMEITALFTL